MSCDHVCQKRIADVLSLRLKLFDGRMAGMTLGVPSDWRTRNRKHRRAAAKPAACAPNAVNTREQGKEGGRVR